MGEGFFPLSIKWERRMNEDIQIAELERRIAELRARLPKHSVPASMLIELEELEEALVQARAEAED